MEPEPELQRGPQLAVGVWELPSRWQKVVGKALGTVVVILGRAGVKVGVRHRPEQEVVQDRTLVSVRPQQRGPRARPHRLLNLSRWELQSPTSISSSQRAPLDLDGPLGNHQTSIHPRFRQVANPRHLPTDQ